MTQAGFDCIEKAKQNGTWSLMDDVEKLILPEDLEIALGENKSSMEFFKGSPSPSKKQCFIGWSRLKKRRQEKRELQK